MYFVWMVLHLGVLINVSSCLSSSYSQVNIKPYSKIFYYKEGESLSFLCQGNFSRTNESRWLFVYPVENFEAVETEGYWVHLNLQASDNGSRLLCYHRYESGPHYVNYSDIITFVIDGWMDQSSLSLLNTGLIGAGSIIGGFITITMVWYFWKRTSWKNKVIPDKETLEYVNQAIINRYQPPSPSAPASAPAWNARPARTEGACPVMRVTNHGYSPIYGNTNKNGKLMYK